jgi:hypothetical protein
MVLINGASGFDKHLIQASCKSSPNNHYVCIYNSTIRAVRDFMLIRITTDFLDIFSHKKSMMRFTLIQHAYLAWYFFPQSFWQATGNLTWHLYI